MSESGLSIQEDRPVEIAYSTGMVMMNFAEGATTLTGEDNVGDPYTGGVFVIVGSVNYKFWPSNGLNYSLGVTFPMMPGDGSLYFDAHFNLEYYFNSVRSREKYKAPQVEISVKPKMRYYAGGELGIANLVYLTETARKSDILFNIGATGGVIFDLSSRWAIRLQTSVVRGTGIIVGGIGIKGLLGGTYYLD